MRSIVFAALLTTAARYGFPSGNFGGQCTPARDLPSVTPRSAFGTTHTVVEYNDFDSDTSIISAGVHFCAPPSDAQEPVDANLVPIDTSSSPIRL